MQSLFEAKKISVETADGARIVSDVSFVVEKKELHVIMGPNGSGKTTLISALMGHPRYTIVEGKILLSGKDLTTVPPEIRAKKGMFLSPQHPPALAGVTLASFIHRARLARFGKRELSPLDRYRSLRQATIDAGLSEALLDRNVNEDFSGGEKKQAEIIQLIGLGPKIAFLDEPDAGLDVDAVARVGKAIMTLRKKGMSVVLITHTPSLLKHVAPTKVHIMKDGHIILSGGKELAERVLEEGYEHINATDIQHS
ncbi:MAG: Fe-S cluster assembly ATPase SufC [Candidatus Yonathbacteria bacterium]|nr:Fe-S cluster assembly ATPase SufC [Candidatus Yonathbacteria bacterium]NTW47799.1 Fe-S cluster assembly ATPase SufC [Candidatus Yonathbacteria bacterium]